MLLWVMEEGYLFHFQGLGLYLRQVEREAEGRSDEGVFMKDFVTCGAQVSLFQGPRNEVGHGAGMSGSERPEGDVHLSAAGVSCRSGRLGIALGQERHLGMASPQNVPVVGHLCSCGGSRCRLLICT